MKLRQILTVIMALMAIVALTLPLDAKPPVDPRRQSSSQSAKPKPKPARQSNKPKPAAHHAQPEPAMESAPQPVQAEPATQPAPQVAQPKQNETFIVNGVSFKMVPVDGGTFMMGSNDGDSDEKPVHSVTLSDYLIGETEVTQALWKAVMGSNPSYFKGDHLPVEKVSWNDCQNFITKLNSLTSQRFRLPTEAEWEYAARGRSKLQGCEYSGSNDISEVAWYTGNSGDKTHAVKTKAPNELGLYDMSGNVYEWCQDWFGEYPSGSQRNPTGPSSGSYRIFRGGSCYGSAAYCRIANRFTYTPTYSDRNLGFRLAL